LSGIRKLAGQTIWYGVPRIFSRFLNFGISLLAFQLYAPQESYAYSQVYALIPFLNILFTYGIETSFFRFAQTHDRQQLYNTLNVSVLATSVIFTLMMFLFEDQVIHFIEMEKHPEYVTWMIWIIFFDALLTLPLARLRLEERPRRYAFINVFGILTNILLVLFFYYIARPAYEKGENNFVSILWNPDIGIGYLIIANLIASGLTLLLLFREFRGFNFNFNFKLWKEVMLYSYPLIIVGFGGMINEMLSRLVYRKILDLPAAVEEKELGIFGANYKLAVLITIFIQVFRLAAEPFFFNQSGKDDAKRTYARVMKFFVIACCGMFLIVVLFLDIWKLLIAYRFKSYAEGIHIVPILTMAGVFLGIYYNLSVWYKLTNRNLFGAWITVAGAVLTILMNILLIPLFGYTGAAWATFICYAFMMIISYIYGQKHYPIPYARKKLLSYLGFSVILYGIHAFIKWLLPDAAFAPYMNFGSGLLLLGVFLLLVIKVERKELINLPWIGKFLVKPG
jgi:O-antigen/teichoic acid export membrane protein